MATQLAAGVWHVDCRTRDRPNVYLVEDGDDLTLVDAGWPGDVATVRQGLADAGVDPAAIDRVLVTHYDADHVGTLARLTPELDAPVFVHRAEAAYVSGERLPPWTARSGLEAIHRLYYRRLSLPDLPVHAVEDGDEIGGFRAYHAPGHTPGHTIFVHEGVDAAFLGDLVYAVGEKLRPSGRITSYDPDQVQKSTRRLLARGLEFEYACPGHGPPLTDGDRRLSEVSERA
jgi:glyoxylase-like metal-dependent hydrolase (beta-lactamase superfamily II)